MSHGLSLFDCRLYNVVTPLAPDKSMLNTP